MSRKFPPVYERSLIEAIKHGELDQYSASHKLNTECAAAIDTALAKFFDHDTCKLYTEAACREVVGKFGFDRTMMVLANTVRHYSFDGRFSQISRDWARTMPHLESHGINRGCLVKTNAGSTDLFIGQVCYDYELAQPLQAAEIKAEARNVLKQFQKISEPNSPDRECFMVHISPEFNARARPEDFVRMIKMLPFSEPALTTLPGHKGFFVVVESSDKRNQQLQKPSIKAQLAAKPVPGDKPVQKSKDREVR